MMEKSGGFLSVVLSAIFIVGLTYWALSKSSAVGQIGKGVVSATGTVENAFQGG
jgi:hypothetical protein